MEHEGGIGKDRILTAVDGVSQNGAADVLHVNTNLMGAASFQTKTHEGKGPVAGNTSIYRVGKLSLG